jgi:hypothetical protein
MIELGACLCHSLETEPFLFRSCGFGKHLLVAVQPSLLGLTHVLGRVL